MKLLAEMLTVIVYLCEQKVH